MNRHRRETLILVAALAGCSGITMAGEKKLDVGQREYETKCVACHGTAGKGNGPVAKYLNVRIPDLTELSKKNGGVFPFARVYESIDGRQQLQAHGTRDMPVWGNAYKFTGNPEYDDYPFNSEAFVRARVLALIDYIHRLQAK
jgi:mono/diheme cytochrome c family protein